MTNENRRDNLRVEMEKGQSSLRAADALLGLALWDDAVTRAYYAAYHHVQALLLTEGLEAKTHAEVHDLLYLRFVRDNRVSADLAKRFAGLQRFREQADYARAFRFTEAGAREEVANAHAICGAIHGLLADGGWLES